MLFINYISSVFISCFFTVNPVVMQQAKDDFKKANDVFAQNMLSVNMTYKFYKQFDDAKPNETKTGRYFKKGESSYSKIADIESIRTKNCIISIQPEEKILVVSNAAKKDASMSLSPDSLLQYCSSINRTETTPGYVKYELVFSKTSNVEFDKIDVVIEKKSATLSKIAMYYRAQIIPSENEADKTEYLQPKFEVLYSGYSNNVSLDPSLFTEEHYVKLISAKTYKGVGKYISYKIYNQKIK